MQADKPDKTATKYLYLRITILGLLVLGLVCFWQLNPQLPRPDSPQTLRQWVMTWGSLGPVLYVGLYSLRPFFLLPSLPFNLAAGILFTPVLACICLLLGGLGSAALVFAAGRLGLGRNFLLVFQSKWGERLDSFLAAPTQGFRHLLWLRVVPIFAYDPVSMAAGCTSMQFRTFVAATAVGMLPGAIAYCFWGEALLTHDHWVAAVLITGAAFGLPLLFWWRKRIRKEHDHGSRGN